MNKVLILMATFNGEKYIKEQIDSLKRQTYKDWDLLISDDHSTDETVNIIREEIKDFPNIRFVYNQGFKGALGNFSYLAKCAKNYNYIMFCDQDDVWFADKIELTLHEMLEQEKTHCANRPILVYTEKEPVDSELNVLKTRQIILKDDLLSLLAQNPIYGCTMMINKALLDKAGNIPCYVQTHDYYYALVAATYGIIFKIPKKLMQYRLHQNNVTGGINNYSILSKFSTWKRINEKIKQMLFQNYMFCKQNMVNDITCGFFNIFQYCGLNRLIKAYCLGYKKEGFLQTLRLYYVLYSFVLPKNCGVSDYVK